jgi:hypothetical protein
MQDTRRITIITLSGTTPDRDWDCRAAGTGSRFVFLESSRVLRYALGHAQREMDLDIDRVVLDRCMNCADFLDLLASLPNSFNADILFIRDDDGGFLSALGRGGDRVMYALTRADVRFYLETNAMVTARTMIPERLSA